MAYGNVCRKELIISMRRHILYSAILLAFLLLILPGVVQAQSYTNNYGIWNYTTTNDTITITEYSGPGGDVTIPDRINGLLVTSISDGFGSCGCLTGIAVPSSVTNIGSAAFPSPILTAITVDMSNSVYSSASGVLFDKNQTTLLIYPQGKSGSYIVPSSVTSIGDYAFYNCTNLTSVTIPNSVTNLGWQAFYHCTSMNRISIGNSVASIQYGAFYSCTGLTNVMIPESVSSIGDFAFNACFSLTSMYFQGNASPYFSPEMCFGDMSTIYYLPETTGWDSLFPSYFGVPMVLWNPSIQTTNASFGVRTNRFGFNIVGTTNIPIVVEASPDLLRASWTSLQSCTITNGSIYFSDPQWTNYPTRFYRIRSP